jgi:hypothetical protein
MAEPAQVTVVIPTFNGKALLRECLDSLRAQTTAGFAVVVSDDASTDGTADMLAADYPEVHCIRRDSNGGFACAANDGLRAVTTPWAFLLNNDMTLESDAVARLRAAAGVGDANLLAPLVLWRGDRGRVYAGGDRVLPGGRPEAIGHGALRTGWTPPVWVFGVSGGAAMLSREALDAVGLFDERFGAYFEDADLCFRARLAGYRARLVPEAVAYHVGSGSLGGRHAWRARQCARNHALLVTKNYPAGVLFRLGLRVLREHLHQMRRVFAVTRSESGAWKALGAAGNTWAGIACRLPHALRERRRIQAARAVSAADVVRWLKRGADG